MFMCPFVRFSVQLRFYHFLYACILSSACRNVCGLFCGMYVHVGAHVRHMFLTAKSILSYRKETTASYFSTQAGYKPTMSCVR